MCQLVQGEDDKTRVGTIDPDAVRVENPTGDRETLLGLRQPTWGTRLHQQRQIMINSELADLFYPSLAALRDRLVRPCPKKGVARDGTNGNESEARLAN